MKPTGPLNVDFAALRTLCLVHSNGSFSGAAHALDINQSSVSYTIDRLRRAFDDPLFVRQGTGIVATPRCREIVAASEQILRQYSAMAEPAEFDPATATVTVTISSNYYERVTILPDLARRVRLQAPGIHLRMVQSLTEGDQMLKSGDADILLSPMPIEEAGFFTRRLFSEHYVCVMDAANPLAAGPVTPEAYCAANHALVSYGSNWRSFYLVAMEEQGLKLNPSLSIPSPEGLAALLDGTDMITTVPSRIARGLSGRLVTRPCPFPAPFEVSMYWTGRTHNSKMQLWLRTLLAQTVAEMLRNESPIEKPD